MKTIFEFIKSTRIISRIIIAFWIFCMFSSFNQSENTMQSIIMGFFVLFVPVIIIEITSNPIIHRNDDRCKFLLFLYNTRLISKVFFWFWLFMLSSVFDSKDSLASYLFFCVLFFLMPAVIVEWKFNPVFAKNKKTRFRYRQHSQINDTEKISVPLIITNYEDNSNTDEYVLKEVEVIESYRVQEIDEFERIDAMDGHEFEYYCADLLERNDFEDVHVTKASGDQGVDIIASKDGIKYAVQCKHWQSSVGNTPIQEICAGKTFYNCHVGVVITNSFFTQKAKELADATGILLWDRDKIKTLIEKSK